jgi:hypothetical protein
LLPHVQWLPRAISESDRRLDVFCPPRKQQQNALRLEPTQKVREDIEGCVVCPLDVVEKQGARTLSPAGGHQQSTECL